MRQLNVLVLLILFASCGQQIEHDKGIEIVLPDTSINHKPNHDYLAVKNLGRKLNLRNLELGVDSIEIRIYEDGALWTPDDLLIIKNENNIWSATLIRYWARFPNIHERDYDSTVWWNMYYNMAVDSSQSFSITPKCSWKNLMDSLNILKFYQLPSQQDIKGFEEIANDGISYHFEIATKGRYKFYTYYCPDIYKDEYNKAATDILRLISRQVSAITLCKYN